MKSRLLGMAAIAWLLSAAIAYANPSPIYLLVQNSVSRNPEVRAAQAEKERLIIQINQSMVGENPVLETAIGRKNDDFASGWTLEAELRQSLQNSDKTTAKKALALNEVTLQEHRIQKLKTALANSILLTLYQIETTSKKIEVNQKRIQKLNWIKSYLSSRPFVSPQKKLEIRLIESDLKAHQLDAIQLKSQLEVFKSEFQKFGAVSVPDSRTLPVVPFKFDLPPQVQIVRKNPDVQLLNTEIEHIQLESKSLIQDAKPDFEIFGRYAVESASETEQFISIGIGTGLPLSNKNRVSLLAQASKKNSLELQRAQLIKDKESQFRSAVSALDQAQEVLKIYDADWARQIELSLDQAIDGFKKDQVDLLSILELESQWVESLNMHHTARLNWVTAYTHLNELLDVVPLGETND